MKLFASLAYLHIILAAENRAFHSSFDPNSPTLDELSTLANDSIEFEVLEKPILDSGTLKPTLDSRNQKPSPLVDSNPLELSQPQHNCYKSSYLTFSSSKADLESIKRDLEAPEDRAVRHAFMILKKDAWKLLFSYPNQHQNVLLELKSGIVRLGKRHEWLLSFHANNSAMDKHLVDQFYIQLALVRSQLKDIFTSIKILDCCWIAEKSLTLEINSFLNEK